MALSLAGLRVPGMDPGSWEDFWSARWLGQAKPQGPSYELQAIVAALLSLRGHWEGQRENMWEHLQSWKVLGLTLSQDLSIPTQTSGLSLEYLSPQGPSIWPNCNDGLGFVFLGFSHSLTLHLCCWLGAKVKTVVI